MIQFVQYSIDIIKDQARQLVRQGAISRQQRIYTLCQYIPVSEWIYVERELENNDFLFRDRIIDLLSREDWEED